MPRFSAPRMKSALSVLDPVLRDLVTLQRWVLDTCRHGFVDQGNSSGGGGSPADVTLQKHGVGQEHAIRRAEFDKLAAAFVASAFQRPRSRPCCETDCCARA